MHKPKPRNALQTGIYLLHGRPQSDHDVSTYYKPKAHPITHPAVQVRGGTKFRIRLFQRFSCVEECPSIGVVYAKVKWSHDRLEQRAGGVIMEQLPQ